MFASVASLAQVPVLAVDAPGSHLKSETAALSVRLTNGVPTSQVTVYFNVQFGTALSRNLMATSANAKNTFGGFLVDPPATDLAVTIQYSDSEANVRERYDFLVQLDSEDSKYSPTSDNPNRHRFLLTVHTYDDNYETASWHLNPTAEALSAMELREGGDPVTLALSISNSPTGSDTFLLSKRGGTVAHSGVVNLGTNGNGIRVEHFGLDESMSVDSSNWEEDRHLVITPMEDADEEDEEYEFTIGYSTSVPETWVTLRQLKGETAIVEEVAVTIRVTDTTNQDFGIDTSNANVNEGVWIQVSVSLTGASRATETAITFSGENFEFDPSTLFIAKDDTSEHPLSVRYEDNIDYADTQNVQFTAYEAGTSRTKMLSFNMGDNDMSGMVLDGGTDLGTVSVGSEEDIAVRLSSEPRGNVEITVGYDTEVGDSNAVTVALKPATLTFTTTNWGVNQTLTLEASSESELALTIDYQITVGVYPDNTGDSIYDTVMPATLSMTLENLIFVEIEDPPASISEGDLVEIRFSLPEASEGDTTLEFRSDTTLPESGVVRFTPADGEFVVPAGETSGVVTVTYDDDIAGADTVINVVITNPDTMEATNHPLTFADNDTLGLQIRGALSGDMATDLGALRVNGSERVDVRLNSRPTDDVVITVGYTTEDGDSNAVTVGIMPAGLTFTADDWDTNQTLTIAPTTASTVAMTITDYRITVGVNGAETDDDSYDPVAATLVATLVNAAFLEIIDVAPSTSVSERATILIRYSLPDVNDIGTTLTFRTDPADLSGVRFIPSDRVTIRSTLEHTVHVTYDDDIDGANTDINVIIADAHDSSRSGSQMLTFRNEDTAGLQVNGVHVTAGVTEDLGLFRINRTETINVRLNTRPETGTTVEVAVGFEREVGESNAVTVSVSPATLTFTAADWDRGKSFAVTPSTGSTVAMTFAYTITVGTGGAGTDDSVYKALADIELAVTLETSRFTEEDVAATEVAIAAVDLGAAQFALESIGGNFIGGRTQLAPDLNLGGGTGSASIDSNDPWSPGDNWRGDFVSILDGGSFRLPLGGGTGRGSLNVWGEGRLLDVSGDSNLVDGSTYTYEGGSRGFVLGLGLQGQGGRLGYGLAVARTNSHVDLQGDSLSVERIDNDLVTLLPYVGMSFGANSRAWLVGGVGEGEAELHMSGEVEKTDSTVRSLGLGLEHTVQRGEYDLSGRLLASGSRSTLDGTEELPDLANVRGTAHRIRAEAEAERDMDLGGRGDGTVFGVAALRRDGGDAGRSFGLELGVGMRARLHDAYTVELEGRHQVNSASHEESSVRLRLGYDTQGDGRGLGLGLDESGTASVGYGWGRTVMGHHGVLSLAVDREDFGEVATTRFGFVSPGLRMSVMGGHDEFIANFDLIVLGH